MEKLLIVAALVCQPGERLIDLSRELPRGLQFMDFVVSLALQLPFLKVSESMGNHDSNIVDAGSVD